MEANNEVLKSTVHKEYAEITHQSKQTNETSYCTPGSGCC